MMTMPSSSEPSEPTPTGPDSLSADLVPSELMAVFGRTKGYLLTRESAHGAVDGIAEIARDTIGAAQGAGVSLMDRHGRRVSVGATDAEVLHADDLQYDLGDGPCLSAWATGTPTYLTDTRTDTRWQQWSEAAASAGIRSCISVPVLGIPVALGAMKVYSDIPAAFSHKDQQVLVNLARSAAVLLGHIQAADTPQRISDDVKASLADRDRIGVARGILMERHDLDRYAAMNHLIELATRAGTTIGSIAAIINNRKDDHSVQGS